MSDYVKFTYERAGAEIARFDELAELNACRWKLLKLHLIGVDSNGVGFGNLSVRDGATTHFYVTGSATGGLVELTWADCVLSDVRSRQIFVMAGHEGGIVAFGKNLEHAFDIVTRERRKSSP